MREQYSVQSLAVLKKNSPNVDQFITERPYQLLGFCNSYVCCGKRFNSKGIVTTNNRHNILCPKCSSVLIWKKVCTV